MDLQLKDRRALVTGSSSGIVPAVRLVQAFVPGMRERRWGRVIQISSRNAISPHAQFGPYGAAKAAINKRAVPFCHSSPCTLYSPAIP
ncbi:SDR family NAD(P)-dependent oxidoreductase [Sorangium sp. So ce1128]